MPIHMMENTSEKQKTCSKCGELKSLDNYSLSSKGIGKGKKYHSRCKVCVAARQRLRSRGTEAYKRRFIPSDGITKICSRCKVEKDVGLFRIDVARSDGYSCVCILCNSEYSSVRSRKKREYINTFKRKGCKICGYRRCYSALEFHHINGDKEFGLSTATCSEQRIKKEISKCIVVCANCHREIHNEGLPLFM